MFAIVAYMYIRHWKQLAFPKWCVRARNLYIFLCVCVCGGGGGGWGGGGVLLYDNTWTADVGAVI